MATPRASIIIPAYNEGEDIVPGLERILAAVDDSDEIIVVVDTPTDTTVAPVERLSTQHPAVSVMVNDYGRGPAHAIRYGIEHATAPTVVVTMADGCDDPRQIDNLVMLVQRGVVVAAASRYMAGGQQVGAARFKSVLSMLAGKSLHALANAGTRDATNSFKAYDAAFVKSVGIDSRDGFEIGLELTAKARRLRLPVAEIPTIWLDRTTGESNFKIAKWIPKYLRWYRFAFGPRLSIDELNEQMKRSTIQ